MSSVRAEEQEEQRIKSTIKDASQKHYDPRTGEIQQGPSAMGSVAETNNPVPETKSGSQNNLYNSNNKLNGIPKQNYTISQNYSTSNISESGEQTLVDGRLNFPIHINNKNGHDKVNEIRPPPREHRSKLKSQSFKYFNRNKGLSTPTSSQDSGFNSAPLNDTNSKLNPMIKDNPIQDYNEMNTITKSPVFVRRITPPMKSSSGSLNVHSSSSKDPSPFGSDIAGDDVSWKGSNGFVDFSPPNNNSMKDTPYDRVLKKMNKSKR